MTKPRIYPRDILFIRAASFFYMSSPMLVTPLIAGYSESLGASAVLMGLIGGLMSVCSLLCRPLMGNLADRFSKYSLSFAGGGCIFLSALGYVLAPNAAVVAAARVVNGIGFACCSVCMSTWMSGLLPRDKIGSGMGVYGTVNALAMAVAPSIGIAVYQAMGYRPAFLFAVFSGAAIMVLIQFVKDKGRPSPARAADPDAGKGGFALVDRHVIPIALITMLFTIPYYATQSFLVSYVEARGLDVSVSLFFPLYAAALLVLRLSLKSLFDRLPFRFFLWGASLSAGASIVLLTFMQSNLTMILAAVCMAGGYGIICSISQSTAILLAGEGRRGLANSTYYVGLDLGMALGPMLGGVLYGHADLAFFYPFFLLTIPLALGICACSPNLRGSRTQ